MQWRQLSCSHAECESHACCGSDACYTSLGGMQGGAGCWRQLLHSHFVCGNHACRGAWVRAAVAFGRRGSDSELWRQLPSATLMRESRLAPSRGVGYASGLSREMRAIRSLESSSSAATL